MSTHRLFVAIYPPPDTVRALVDALGGLDLPPHRPTPEAQVHLTLQFIGDTAVRDVDTVVESVTRAASGLDAMALAPQRLIALPTRGPVRLVAAETDAPATLLEIKRRLVVRLARGARREPADRFLPHLTLCRFRAPTRMAVRPEAALAVPPFDVPAIRVMRSVLRPEGARHDEVASVGLG